MFIFILLHQLHVQLLGGCALTILQKKVRAIPQKQDFFQYLVYRLFSLKINTFQGSLINYLVLVLAFSISLFHFGW